MLKCHDIAAQASDYLDRNQNSRQRLAVAMHLLMCGKCRVFIRHLRTTLAYYRELSEQPLGDAEAITLAKRVIGE